MEYTIYVGTSIKIKKGFLKGAFTLMYCGMMNDEIFVMSPLITYGYQGFSPNVYYRIDSNTIQIRDKVFEVIEVTPEYIVLGD